MIQQLPDNVRSYLRSGVAVTSVTQCVEELFLNAVDAGATCVAVRVDLDVFKIQVVDNGQGLPPDQLDMLGERYCTSKCHHLSDLNKLSHFGYRGEALASIRESCGVMEVTTRPKSSTKTYCKMFTNGAALKVTDSTIPRPSAGTTITVHDLFKNFPVRRKATHTGLEIERIKQRLEGLALLKPHISVSLRNDLNGNVILQTHKGSDTIKTFSYLFGSEKAKYLVAVEGMNVPFTVRGYIGIAAHTKKDLQFVYINGRVVLKTKIHKMVNQAMGKSVIFKRGYGQGSSTPEITQKQSSSSSPTKYLDKQPFYVLDIICPLTEYDITFDPSKTLVEFKDWNKLLQCINDMVNVFLKKEKLDTSPDAEITAKIKTSLDQLNTGADSDSLKYNRISPSNMKDTISSKKVKRQKMEESPQDLYTTPQTVSIEEWKASNLDHKPETSSSAVEDESNITVSSEQNSSDMTSTEISISVSNDDLTVLDSNHLKSAYTSESDKSIAYNSKDEISKPESEDKESIVPALSTVLTGDTHRNIGSKPPLPYRHRKYFDLANSPPEAGIKVPIPSTQSSVPYSSLSMYKKALENKTIDISTDNRESEMKQKSALQSQNDMLSSLQRFRNKVSKASNEIQCRDENPLCSKDAAKQNILTRVTKIQLASSSGESKRDMTKSASFRNETSKGNQLLNYENRGQSKAFPHTYYHVSKPYLEAPLHQGEHKNDEDKKKQMNRKRMFNIADSRETTAAKVARLVKQKIFSVSVEPVSSERYLPSVTQIALSSHENQRAESHFADKDWECSYSQNSNSLVECDDSFFQYRNSKSFNDCNKDISDFEIQSQLLPIYAQAPVQDNTLLDIIQSKQYAQTIVSNSLPVIKPNEPDKDNTTNKTYFSLSGTTICDMNSNSSSMHCGRPLDSPMPPCSAEPNENVFAIIHKAADDNKKCMNEQGDASVIGIESFHNQQKSISADTDILSTKDSEDTHNTIDMQHEHFEDEPVSEDTPMFTAVRLNIATPTNEISNEQSIDNIDNIARHIDSDPFIVSTIPFSPKLDKLSQLVIKYEDTHSQGITNECKKTICLTPESQGFTPHVDLNISTDVEENSCMTVTKIEEENTESFNYSSTESSDKKNPKTLTNDAVTHLYFDQAKTAGDLCIQDKKVVSANEYHLHLQPSYTESVTCSGISQDTLETIPETGLSNAKNESATQDMDDTYADDCTDLIGSDDVSVTQLLNQQTSSDIHMSDSTKSNAVLFSDIFSPTQGDSLPSLCQQCDENSNLKSADLETKNQVKTFSDQEYRKEAQELTNCSWNSSWSSMHEETKGRDNRSIETDIILPQACLNINDNQDIQHGKTDSNNDKSTTLPRESNAMSSVEIVQGENVIPITDIPKQELKMTEVTTPLFIGNENTQVDHEKSEAGQWLEMKDPISGKQMFVHSKSGATIFGSDFKGNLKENDIPKSNTSANVNVRLPQTGSVRIQVPGTSKEDMSLPPSSALVDMVDQYLEKEEMESVDIKWRTPAEREKLRKTENTVESIFCELDEQGSHCQSKELMKGEISDLPSRALVNAYKSMHSCTFTKDMLNNVQVVGQLDKKFITCIIDSGKEASKSAESNMLAVIDQHAAHERIRLEMLTEEAYEECDRETGRLCRYTVTPPRCKTFTEDEVRVIVSFKDEFKRIGIILKKDLQNRVSVHIHSVPQCLVVKGDPEGKRKEDFIYWDTIEALIRDHVELLKSSGGSRGRLPKVIHKVLCSLACHGAIKFGDPLTLLECETLIKDLALCDLPFQCAHGRPSVMPVLPLDQLNKKLGQQKQSKPKLYKLRSNVIPERQDNTCLTV